MRRPLHRSVGIAVKQHLDAPRLPCIRPAWFAAHSACRCRISPLHECSVSDTCSSVPRMFRWFATAAVARWSSRGLRAAGPSLLRLASWTRVTADARHYGRHSCTVSRPPKLAGRQRRRPRPTGSRRTRRCCSPSRRPTATRPSSPTPTGSTYLAASGRTCRSATASMSASAHRWPGAYLLGDQRARRGRGALHGEAVTARDILHGEEPGGRSRGDRVALRDAPAAGLDHRTRAVASRRGQGRSSGCWNPTERPGPRGPDELRRQKLASRRLRFV